MEIWNWIEKLNDTLNEAGQSAGARLLSDFTNAVCDQQIERAEALLPEARALAKSLENPWLEVFVGHWEMRYRLGDKLEGQSALRDMVALFERAHRKDAIDCPQSVCVTQDLSNCYGNIDAPGWAAERRAVVEETLQRIDPSWNCFTCLSEEYANALYSEGRYAEALDWIDAQEARMRQAGREDFESLEQSRSKHLMALERAEEAVALLEAQTARAEKEQEWESDCLGRRIYLALALALSGRDDAAWEMLPSWNETVPAQRTEWIAAIGELLPRAPERNTWALGRDLQTQLDHLDACGAYRPLIDSALICARLALARGAGFSARRILALARKNQKCLRVDAGAAAQLDELECAIEQCPALALPVAAEKLVAHLETLENRDPEHEVEWLLAAHAQLPDDIPVLQVAAGALQACGAHNEAEALLWRFIETHPRIDDEPPYDVLMRLSNAWLDRRQGERLETLARLYDAIEPPFALWCRARWAERCENWAEVVDFCERGLALAPDRESLSCLLANALCRQKRFTEAAAVWLQVANRQEGPCSELWDHMSCAAAAGDWTAVRQSAARLELDIDPGDGPFVENWGWLIIRFEENGEPIDYYAQRTGPVTARILENAPPRCAQHVRDDVVFDAAPLYAPPEDEEERKNFIITYSVLHILTPGECSRSWLVEGVHPGQEALDALKKKLEDAGHEVWIINSDYSLQDAEAKTEADAARPGLLFSVASPKDIPPLKLNTLLETLTHDWPEGLCWLGLAKHCGVDTSRHEALAQRFDL